MLIGCLLDAYWCLLVPIGAYWCLLVFIGCLLDAYWMPIGAHGMLIGPDQLFKKQLNC